MSRRIVSILLCIVLIIGLLPTVVFAEDVKSINFSIDTGVEGLIKPPFYARYQTTVKDPINNGDSFPAEKDG